MAQHILDAHARAVELLKHKQQGEYPSGNPLFKREFLQRELGVRAGIVELNHTHVKRITVKPGEKRSTVIEMDKMPRGAIEARLSQRGYRLMRTKFRHKIVTAIYRGKKLGHLVENEQGVEMELKKGAVEEVVRTIFSDRYRPKFHSGERPNVEVKPF